MIGKPGGSDSPPGTKYLLVQFVDPQNTHDHPAWPSLRSPLFTLHSSLFTLHPPFSKSVQYFSGRNHNCSVISTAISDFWNTCRLSDDVLLLSPAHFGVKKYPDVNLSHPMNFYQLLIGAFCHPAAARGAGMQVVAGIIEERQDAGVLCISRCCRKINDRVKAAGIAEHVVQAKPLCFLGRRIIERAAAGR